MITFGTNRCHVCEQESRAGQTGRPQAAFGLGEAGRELGVVVKHFETNQAAVKS